MRHRLANQVAAAVAVVALAAAVLFALVERRDPGAGARIEAILAIDADAAEGLRLYNETSPRSCAACHSLAAAGAVSDRASDLDQLRPDRRAVLDSILSGTIRAHEAQSYRSSLSDRDMADLAAFVAQAVGRD